MYRETETEKKGLARRSWRGHRHDLLTLIDGCRKLSHATSESGRRCRRSISLSRKHMYDDGQQQHLRHSTRQPTNVDRGRHHASTAHDISTCIRQHEPVYIQRETAQTHTHPHRLSTSSTLPPPSYLYQRQTNANINIARSTRPDPPLLVGVPIYQPICVLGNTSRLYVHSSETHDTCDGRQESK